MTAMADSESTLWLVVRRTLQTPAQNLGSWGTMRRVSRWVRMVMVGFKYRESVYSYLIVCRYLFASPFGDSFPPSLDRRFALWWPFHRNPLVVFNFHFELHYDFCTFSFGLTSQIDGYQPNGQSTSGIYTLDQSRHLLLLANRHCRLNLRGLSPPPVPVIVTRCATWLWGLVLFWRKLCGRLIWMFPLGLSSTLSTFIHCTLFTRPNNLTNLGPKQHHGYTLPQLGKKKY